MGSGGGEAVRSWKESEKKPAQLDVAERNGTWSGTASSECLIARQETMDQYSKTSGLLPQFNQHYKSSTR